jgi:hypothetical protein
MRGRRRGRRTTTRTTRRVVVVGAAAAEVPSGVEVLLRRGGVNGGGTTMGRRGPGLRPGDAPQGGSSTATCTRWLLAAATTLEAGQRGETLCP